MKKTKDEEIAELRQAMAALIAENETLTAERGKYYATLASLEYRINKYRIYSLEEYIEGWDD
ncbi:hypothetical protein MCZ47_16485 [Bacillus altitudinis]|uniref:hypothetical protein n=1 Tax=Bacillus altitudinis TaxID=293387 RepID=UPI00227DF31A|nr:hypothetical protein [Bacillus altitudinis]MCY7451839.1 hypothetical protein [Bacillus altitudinis]